MADLLAEKNHSLTHTSPENTLDFIHTHKTCALITASLNIGARLAFNEKEPDTIIPHLNALGQAIGLLFQIVDDILDATTESNHLGKTTGKDALLEKLTYPRLYGLETSKKMAHSYVKSALNLYEELKVKNTFLRDLIISLEHRIQ
jgi:geranylgeranyl pyrophosphate synthase